MISFVRAVFGSSFVLFELARVANSLEILAGKTQSAKATNLTHSDQFFIHPHLSGYYFDQSLAAVSTLSLSLFQLSRVYFLDFHRAVFRVSCCAHQLYFSTWR